MIDPTMLFPEGPPEVFENAPASLLAVGSRVDYRDALAPGDPRYVPTAEARAEKFVRHFYATFGYDKRSGGFLPPGQGKHVLFFGHVGCGKSTELSRMCEELEDPLRYWVVQIDLLELIDAHDARYSDVWLAVAQKLIEKLLEQGIEVEPVVFNRLRNWFAERVLTHEALGELKAGVDFEASAGAGLPLIAKLLARFTTSVKVGSSYRETLRMVMRNTYGDFVAALNLLITDVTARIRAAGKGQEILFVIDGADRFRREDWERFFVDEVNQLVLVRCIAVYTAPMALKSSGKRLDLFDSLVLPMVKLHEFNAAGDTRREAGFAAMRQVVLKRCHYRLFDSLETLDQLIEFSGGHLRDLLRLLYFACIEAEDAVLDLASVEAAAHRLAGEYRSWVPIEDYPVLAEAARQPQNLGVSEAVTRLVEGGALLEYNSGSWRQPHPVVRLLPAYLRAAAA